MRCPLCRGLDTPLKFVIDRFRPSFPVRECRSCGFLFQPPPRGKARAFYGRDYYSGKARFSYLDERKNETASRLVWDARVRILSRLDRSRTPPGGRKYFLDVGCSFGGLMQAAADRGYKPAGVEISRYSGEYARKRFGRKSVLIGNVEKIRLPQGRYSAVTLVEAIEHLSNPARALKNISGAMAPGGILLIQTADMAGWQARLAGSRYHYYLPGHFSYFTRDRLERLLTECGFSRTRFIGGVEFGLLPKLRKSAAGFRTVSDYFRWFRIAAYHIASKASLGRRFHLTSSMVMLAWK